MSIILKSLHSNNKDTRCIYYMSDNTYQNGDLQLETLGKVVQNSILETMLL